MVLYVQNYTFFTSSFQGPNHTFSADGFDKLMDFIRDTFPLAIKGWEDGFSGRLMFLNVWTSNSDPKPIAVFCYDLISIYYVNIIVGTFF